MMSVAIVFIALGASLAVYVNMTPGGQLALSFISIVFSVAGLGLAIFSMRDSA